MLCVLGHRISPKRITILDNNFKNHPLWSIAMFLGTAMQGQPSMNLTAVLQATIVNAVVVSKSKQIV